MVWIPHGRNHRHGAAPDNSLARIAVSEALDGKAVEWVEQVGDAQDGAPLRAQGPTMPGTRRAAPAVSLWLFMIENDSDSLMEMFAGRRAVG